MGNTKSDPAPAPRWPRGNWFLPAFPCLCDRCCWAHFPGNSAAPAGFQTHPSPFSWAPFYWNKLEMRLSGAYNNCEIFLLEISVSHLFGKIFSPIIHYRGLKIILQWQSLYLFLDNWHPLLADLECFFDDNACNPAGFAECLHKQRQIVKCGKEKSYFYYIRDCPACSRPNFKCHICSIALQLNALIISRVSLGFYHYWIAGLGGG